MLDLKYAQKEFERFLDEYDREDEKVKLKIVHTYGVVECAERICKKMNLDQENRDLACLIALLHDIGRFEQLKRFDSFMPDTMDHAAYGVEILFGKERMIRRFVKCDKWDEIIKMSIAKHSDYKLEGIEDEKILLHARLIRDADKLDNCRVKLEEPVELMIGADEYKVGATEISPRIWEYCLKKEAVLSCDRVTLVDYWVSYVAYFFDINYAETLAIIQEAGYVDKIIHRIPYTNPMTKKKMEDLSRMIKDYISECTKKS